MIFELDKKVLLYWRFTAAVLFAAVFSGVVFCFQSHPYAGAVTCTVVTAVFSAVIFAYLPKLFKMTNAEVKDGVIVCRKGCFFRREYIFPNPQLVYIQNVRLPLAFLFGLQTNILRGAGNSLIMPPLNLDQSAILSRAVQGRD